MSVTTLEIKAFSQDINSGGQQYAFINFQAVDYFMQPTIQEVMQYGAVTNSAATPYPIFTNPSDAITFYATTDVPALLIQVNDLVGSSYYTDTNLELVDTPVQAVFNELATVAFSGEYSDLSGNPLLAAIATSGAFSDLTGAPTLSTVATSGSYSDLSGKPALSAVAISGSYSDLTGKPSIPAAQVNSDWNAVSGISQISNKPSLATVATSGSYIDLSNKPTIPTIPTLSFNNAASHSIVTGAGATGFQVSSSRNALINYSVTISTSSTITSGSVGVVVLEIAPTNSTTAADWVEIGRVSQGQTLGLALALSITQPIAAQVGGVIPMGYYAKLRSINTTGTPTYSYNSGQEVLM